MKEMTSSWYLLRVFLCHSSEDKPQVRELCARLVKDGADPWLDEKKLLPGQDWNAEITKAVRASNVVIVCLSHRSVSKEGFVQKEIKQALDVADEKPDGTIFIIPVRLDDCEVPARLQRWQWVDLNTKGGYERLARALRARVDAINGQAIDSNLLSVQAAAALVHVSSRVVLRWIQTGALEVLKIGGKSLVHRDSLELLRDIVGEDGKGPRRIPPC